MARGSELEEVRKKWAERGRIRRPVPIGRKNRLKR